MRVLAINVPMNSPSDVSGLEQAFRAGQLRPEDVICIIGKTEGNGGRNDFTRDLAMRAFQQLFREILGIPPAELGRRVVFSFSGGTEGVVSPHMVVFARDDGATANGKDKRLAIGIGQTRQFRPEEIGRMPQIEETAAAVRSIVQELGAEPADVHLVQMKGAIPFASFEESEKAKRTGSPLRNDMVYSRGASALGAALALGEIEGQSLNDDVVCRDWSLYSSVASCSAKPGLEMTEIIVFANSANWGGDLVIDHAVLDDILDVPAMQGLLSRLGLAASGQLTQEQSEKIVGVFAKSEADPRGTIRGRRHTMLSDDDISDTRYSRCVLSAVIASVLGITSIYVSTRAEHHGPLGGGTLAVIARAE